MTDEQHTDRHDFDDDAELRALLRSADPASSLPPADPASLSELLEDIMSVDLDVRPDAPEEGTRADGTRGRNRLTWLVAAAAATVIAGAAGFALSGSGGDAGPPAASDQVAEAPAGQGDAQAPADPTAPIAGTTDLSAPAASTGRCMAPNAAFIAGQEQAFAGTVTAVEGDTVTLSTTDVYAGQVGETVVVSAPSAELQALIASTSFEVGSSYLVSATDGVVSVCGMTGKASGSLQTLYDEAFAR